MIIGMVFHGGRTSLKPDTATAMLGLVLFPPNVATIPKKLCFESKAMSAYCQAKSLLHNNGLPTYFISFVVNVAAFTYGHGNPAALSTFQANPITSPVIQPDKILSSAF